MSKPFDLRKMTSSPEGLRAWQEWLGEAESADWDDPEIIYNRVQWILEVINGAAEQDLNRLAAKPDLWEAVQDCARLHAESQNPEPDLLVKLSKAFRTVIPESRYTKKDLEEMLARLKDDIACPGCGEGLLVDSGLGCGGSLGLALSHGCGWRRG